MGEFIYQKREKEEKGMIQRRSIAMCIILSLVTCGIYGIYWFVVLTDDANTLLPDNKGLNNTSGGVAFLLSLVTCGIYGLYWAYKQGEKIDEAKTARGIIYLLLTIFGFGIIAEALMQNELNSMAF